MSTGMLYRCADCGKEFAFQSTSLTIYVCPSCFSIHHKGANDEGISTRKSPPVPEDMSLLMIGSELTYDGVKYAVVGRYRFQMISSYRNCWIASDMADGILYIIEALGYYAVCKKSMQKLTASNMKELQAGNDMVHDSIKLYIDGIDRNSLTSFEGELSEIDEYALPFFAADLSNNTGDYAFARVLDKKESVVYMGKYGLFSDFKFSKTKSLDGWK